jgi:hypothetical protein
MFPRTVCLLALLLFPAACTAGFVPESQAPRTDGPPAGIYVPGNHRAIAQERLEGPDDYKDNWRLFHRWARIRLYRYWRRRIAFFHAELQNADPLRGLEWTLAAGGEIQSSAGPMSGQYQGTTQIYTHRLPGVGTFFMRGDRFRLPQSFKLIWKTRALE